jgi:hypothetical protein
MIISSQSIEVLIKLLNFVKEISARVRVRTTASKLHITAIDKFETLSMSTTSGIDVVREHDDDEEDAICTIDTDTFLQAMKNRRNISARIDINAESIKVWSANDESDLTIIEVKGDNQREDPEAEDGIIVTIKEEVPLLALSVFSCGSTPMTVATNQRSTTFSIGTSYIFTISNEEESKEEEEEEAVTVNITAKFARHITNLIAWPLELKLKNNRWMKMMLFGGMLELTFRDLL